MRSTAPQPQFSIFDGSSAVRRLIVTGANGTGKSHVARRLQHVRPEVPVVSFDAIKLTSGWRQKPRPAINEELARAVALDAWILEGGPSLLPLALPRADAVLWLDPPDLVRAWRLAIRPWRNLGRTRSELPSGNVDWPIQQYAFAHASLRNGSRVRHLIAEHLSGMGGRPVWRCRSGRQVEAAVEVWRIAG
jgi:adenylate kinase family enzyme